MSVRSSAITNNGVLFGDEISASFRTAESVDLIVSFLKESGISVIGRDLRDALDRGVRVRVLTGTYLGITSPFALEELLSLKGDIRVRLFDGTGSFHPKAYIFRHPGGCGDEAFIGSSNLSGSALTSGVEWNYRLRRSSDPESFDLFQREFDHLFSDRSVPLTDEVLEEYARTWRSPALRIDPDTEAVGGELYLEGPQISARNALEMTREDGMERALLVAATGVGKTVIAAKDSEGFGRVLFVAHRREILEQAKRTFLRVRRGSTAAVMCDGGDPVQECLRADMLFASVQSLSDPERLGMFGPEDFDYMVVDEFHHAASSTYRRVVDHFRPRFMLGLTATPERLDGEDIFDLCDRNVPYRIDMADAIRFGRLVPFSYHGVADDVDYSGIRYRNGRYDGDELTRALANGGRADRILAHYLRYPSARALGFCSSVEHALFMRDRFSSRGIPSKAVVSSGGDDRRLAVRGLEEGTVSVLFTVDMFNEGVDIPSVDMVMFLRPTESPTVFLQQLGRGLRLHPGKERLTVLDFIGNYAKVDRIPQLLTGDPRVGTDPRDISRRAPPGCAIDYDLESIDILRRMARRDMTLRQMADAEYDRVREGLGRVPSRAELFERMDRTTRSRQRMAGGIFKDYLGYLIARGDAGPIETSLHDGPGGRFIRMVETTGMSEQYKMIVLSSFFGDAVRTEVTVDDILATFRSFYSDPRNREDFVRGRSGRYPDRMTDAEWRGIIMRQPVARLARTSGFISAEGDRVSLSHELDGVIGLPDFVRHVRDAIRYRIEDFRSMRGDDDGEAGEGSDTRHHKGRRA